MRKFFTVVLGSFVGTWLAILVSAIVSIVLGFAIFGSLLSGGATQAALQEHSVLCLDLGVTVTERSQEASVLDVIMSGETSTMGLHEIVDAVEAASKDDNIDGMLINCGGINAGMSSMYEIRKAIKAFRQSKKFVYAYGYDGISQGDYYLCSAADSVFVNPLGSVDVHGLASQNLFFKNVLDKIGVEMQVIRVGSFKSAVEPFMLDNISDANRMQQEHYIGSIWKRLSAAIAEDRKVSVQRLNELADSMLLTKSPAYLLKNRLVDGICYKRQMEDKLKARTVGRDDDVRMVSLDEVPLGVSDSGGSEIAVVYAEGEIDGGDAMDIDSETLASQIEDLAEEDDVKAMVLRVNSPGGSAFGSEQIWKAVADFKAAGKKVAVSMGDLAASGGYYIACGADRIFACPVTITGSIGIYGMIPCFAGLVTDKLGINQSLVATNANGGFGSALSPLTEYQRAAMQEYINRGYDLFTKRCAKGRGVSQDDIKKIAEGRVWDGASAKEIGLVDEFGSLADAVRWVAKASGVKDYHVGEYPASASRWQKTLEGYFDSKYDQRMKQELGEIYDYHKEIRKMLGRDKVLCLAMPVRLM